MICVIDVSGSMKDGNKLNLVKKTLKFILSFLTEKDRICLIKFSTDSHRILNLTKTSDENKPKIHKIVDSLQSNGSTAIEKGLQKAIK